MKRLLYVDDDPNYVQICKYALENAGYQVVTAGNGPAAIHAISVQPIDCAILDYRMPLLNGVAVAQAIKQVRPDVPICLFTHSACLHDEDAKMIDQVISKGDGPEVLITWLRSLCEQPQSLKEVS